MKWFGTLMFYKTPFARRNQRYRWRFVYANGKKGPNGGEGFSSIKDAERSAYDFMGIGPYGTHRGEVHIEFLVPNEETK